MNSSSKKDIHPNLLVDVRMKYLTLCSEWTVAPLILTHEIMTNSSPGSIANFSVKFILYPVVSLFTDPGYNTLKTQLY